MSAHSSYGVPTWWLNQTKYDTCDGYRVNYDAWKSVREEYLKLPWPRIGARAVELQKKARSFELAGKAAWDECAAAQVQVPEYYEPNVPFTGEPRGQSSASMMSDIPNRAVGGGSASIGPILMIAGGVLFLFAGISAVQKYTR
jgi:hypothetical protein